MTSSIESIHPEAIAMALLENPFSKGGKAGETDENIDVQREPDGQSTYGGVIGSTHFEPKSVTLFDTYLAKGGVAGLPRAATTVFFYRSAAFGDGIRNSLPRRPVEQNKRISHGAAILTQQKES